MEKVINRELFMLELSQDEKEELELYLKGLILLYPNAKANVLQRTIDELNDTTMYEKQAREYLRNKRGLLMDGLWCVDDVKLHAKDEYKVDLTERQAGEILDEIGNRFDASIGINWETLEYYIEQYIHENNLEYKTDEDEDED